MKNLLFLSIGLLAFISCKNTASKDATTDTKGAPVEAANGAKSLCYLRVFGKDTTTINITINLDGTVTGTYDWAPWEKDGSTGTLKGRKQDDILTLLYDYTIEGSNQQEEKIMKLTGDLLAEAEGELTEAEGGVLKIKEGTTPNWKALSKVNCK